MTDDNLEPDNTDDQTDPDDAFHPDDEPFENPMQEAPQPSAEDLALFHAIAEFVNAPDWDQSAHVLETYPELLDHDTRVAINSMIDQALGVNDFQKARLLAVHRDLLALIAEEGSDAAFARVGGEPPEELLVIIADFVNAQTWAQSRAYLEANPELLSLEAAAAFEALIQAAYQQGDERRHQLLVTHRNLLLLVEERGIDQAFESIEQPMDENILQVIAEFVYAGSPQKSKQVLQQHPELLSDHAEQTIKQLITDAQRESEDEMALMLTLHLNLLRRAREEGIEAAFEGQGDAPNENLMQKVVDFVNADGVEGSRQILEANPELLTEEADEAIETLINTAKAQNRGEIVHHLQTYRDLLRVCREMGIEEAFKHVASPDNVLDAITAMTVQAIQSGDTEAIAEWRGQLGQFNEQAQTLGDEPMAALTDAVARLLMGANPEKLGTTLTGAHKAAWDQIVAAKSEHDAGAAE